MFYIRDFMVLILDFKKVKILKLFFVHVQKKQFKIT